LIVVDNGWTTCGAGAEIVAQVAERLMGVRDLRVRRLGFAPTTCPTTPSLEAHFYPNARTIAAAARDLVEGTETGWIPEENPDLQGVEFRGPF
jgi:pyruvate/2-oxoglutarate/acetoin dehydrogenase E1 component